MKCLVLLSGGVDSTTALYWACREHEPLAALSFRYGSNHEERELACAEFQARALGIPHCVVDISPLAAHLSSALLSGAAAIPSGDYGEENMRATVVPFRNGIFLSVAAGIAESRGAKGVVIAAHAGDHAIYPDCREPFMRAMEQAMKQGSYEGVQLLRPFIAMSKIQIVKLGAQLNVDFSRTYSCYCGGEKHCGRCGTCRERREAFAIAGVTDPTVYEY